MTFEEATGQMFAAIQARDMCGLTQALRARQAAIDAGFIPTLKTIEDGERALVAMAALKRSLALESSRLRQLQTGVAGTLSRPSRPQVDCKG